MFASTSGRSRFGLRIEPRSPPVQVTMWTSTPSATYFAVVAAPLLDSSSGCACTCISRSPDVEGDMVPILGKAPGTDSLVGSRCERPRLPLRHAGAHQPAGGGRPGGGAGRERGRFPELDGPLPRRPRG